MESTTNSHEEQRWEVKLEIFEGPMDLLLHLIRKNEVDIFDIPIATITEQYLQYLDLMKALNINLAGEFFVMASTLIHIKSKMLLPQSEDDQEDPRTEITRPLLEYMHLKEAAKELSSRELLDRDVFKRPPMTDIISEIDKKEPLIEVNIFQLIDAFREVIERRLPGAEIRYQVEKWSVRDSMKLIINRLSQRKKLLFTQLFEKKRTISELVITFLALLELVRFGLIRIYQREPEADILIETSPVDDDPISIIDRLMGEQEQYN